MAKRQSSEDIDPFDLPFEDNLDDMKVDVGDLRLDDASVGDHLFESADPTMSTRAPLGIGQIIVGVIQVIVLTVIVLAIFLAIGFGAIYGGQRLGVVPTRTSGSSGAVIAPTTGVAQQPTAAPQVAAQAATAIRVVPTLTPDLGCTVASIWWNSQQVQDSYRYFTTQALSDARDSTRLPALLEQMRIRHDFVANFPADPCLSEARDALLHSFDATMDAARVIGDPAAFSQQQANQAQAFAALTAALWAVSVNTDADSAPAQNVARNSGVTCGAQAWYDLVKPHEQAFLAAAQQIDLTTMSMGAVQPLLDRMLAERGNVADVSVPTCAVKAQAILLGALDAYGQAFDQQIAAKSVTIDLSEYTRQHTLFLAWLQWLAVS